MASTNETHTAGQKRQRSESPDDNESRSCHRSIMLCSTDRVLEPPAEESHLAKKLRELMAKAVPKPTKRKAWTATKHKSRAQERQRLEAEASSSSYIILA